MRHNNKNFKNNIRKLENIILPCNGQPRGTELPQAATANDVMTDLIHQCTGESIEFIDTYNRI